MDYMNPAGLKTTDGITILLAEDNAAAVQQLEKSLTGQGYSVLTAVSGDQALGLAKRALPDLIVLDLRLAGMDGLAVTRRLREDRLTRDLPIIMLAPRANDRDIITSLETGANDVMSTPFGIGEFLARVRTVLRGRKKRSPYIPNRFHQAEELVIDRAKHSVNINGEDIGLTLSEFHLLTLLGDKRGWVFTRKQIVEALHGKGTAVAERSIDVMVAGLRKKLKQSAPVIETVRGVGYRFRE
ncbi:MAG: response regulator transcription factor [Desulfobacula sp.]|nr:response regulator transcription factor [Desulfobacula sp.]